MAIVDLSRLSFDMRGLYEPSKAVFISFDEETWSVGQRKEELKKLQSQLSLKATRVFLDDNRTPTSVEETDVIVCLLTKTYVRKMEMRPGESDVVQAYRQFRTKVVPVASSAALSFGTKLLMTALNKTGKIRHHRSNGRDPHR